MEGVSDLPVRIGFAAYRQGALEAELDRVAEMIPQLGVQRAILIGDLAAGRVGPESSLDLVMVMEVQGSFTRRMDFFTSHLGPMVATNYFVYTPGEFEGLQHTNLFLRNALKGGRTVYEA